MGIFCFISKNRNTYVTNSFFNTFFFLFNLDKTHSLHDDFDSETQQSCYINFIALKPNKISQPKPRDVF